MDEKIIKFIFIIAMRDATLQKSYKGKKAWLTNIDSLPKIKNAFTKFIDAIINNKFNNQEDFDKEFLKLSHEVCDEINTKAGNNEFTFGNAQKLINITTKYLYIWSYKDSNKKECFRWCHCPMDRIMIEHVWANRKQLSFKLGKSGAFHKSWGNGDFENKDYPQRYKDFQKAIQELAGNKFNRVEYDYSVWSN